MREDENFKGYNHVPGHPYTNQNLALKKKMHFRNRIDLEKDSNSGLGSLD